MASAALQLKEGVAPVGDRVATMAFLAALLHGIVILGVTFGGDAPGSQAPGLQVLLVSDEVPEADRNDDAAYLAQRTQLGSGQGDEARTPRNPARGGLPEPPQPESQESVETRDRLLTASASSMQIRYVGEIAALTPPRRRDAARPDDGVQEIETGEDAEPVELAGRERAELWITPDTRESSLAPYLDAWRRKVERLGTLNFPAAARDREGVSSPVLEVAIDASGRLESAVIRQSSGSPALDAAAISILKLASPFEPFPKALAANYRVLRFAYAWEFAGGRAAAGTVTAPADSR